MRGDEGHQFAHLLGTVAWAGLLLALALLALGGLLGLGFPA